MVGRHFKKLFGTLSLPSHLSFLSSSFSLLLPNKTSDMKVLHSVTECTSPTCFVQNLCVYAPTYFPTYPLTFLHKSKW